MGRSTRPRPVNTGGQHANTNPPTVGLLGGAAVLRVPRRASNSFRVRCPVQEPGPHEIAECFDGSRAEVVAVPVAPYVGISEDVHG